MPQRESDSSRKCHHYSDTLLVRFVALLRSRMAPFLAKTIAFSIV
jgi:hypothetical protein